MKSFLLTFVVIVFSTGLQAQTLKSELKSLDGGTNNSSIKADNAALQKQEQNARPDLKQNLKSGSVTNSGKNTTTYTPDKKTSVGISNQQIKRDILNTRNQPRTKNTNKTNVDMDKLKTL